MTCTATDGAGNASTCTFHITVEDREAPVVTCPADMTVPRETNDGAIVSFDAPATDNASLPTVTCSALRLTPAQVERMRPRERDSRRSAGG